VRLSCKKFTWHDFDESINTITEGLRPYKGHIQNIYGIPRGGLVLAVVLSHILELPLVSTFKEGSNTLVVDDISDSGKTLLPFRRAGCTIATIHVVSNTLVYPEVWVHMRESEWVIYPWEKGD